MGVRKLSALSVSRPWIDETLIRQVLSIFAHPLSFFDVVECFQVYLEMVYRLCLYRAVDFAEKVLEKEEMCVKTFAMSEMNLTFFSVAVTTSKRSLKSFKCTPFSPTKSSLNTVPLTTTIHSRSSLLPTFDSPNLGVKGFRSVKKSPEPFYYDAKKHFLFVPGKGMAILYRALEKMLPFASYDCEKVFCRCILIKWCHFVSIASSSRLGF